MGEMPSLQSFKLASLYSPKDLGSEAGASQDKVVATIWQGVNSQQSPLEAASLGETTAEPAGGRLGLWISSFYLLVSLFSRLCSGFLPGDLVLVPAMG